jgi:hypothetical protein
MRSDVAALWTANGRSGRLIRFVTLHKFKADARSFLPRLTSEKTSPLFQSNQAHQQEHCSTTQAQQHQKAIFIKAVRCSDALTCLDSGWSVDLS